MVEFRGESTVQDIKKRFDHDVERFSNLETGQSATMDAPLALQLVVKAALAVNPRARRVLDLGCGAGNFTLRLLQSCDTIEDVTLVDLSRPMLERAEQRVREQSAARVTTLQGDLREIDFECQQYDIIFAGAVLHHLRTPDEWIKTFQRICTATSCGGSFWIFDLITHAEPSVQQLLWDRYGEYLTSLKGTEYRDHVFEYIASEDTPRTLIEQIDWLRQAGFTGVEILHVNTCFAAFGGIKRNDIVERL